MDRVSTPPEADALSFPMAVRRLARDAHRLLDPSSDFGLAEVERLLDQAARLRRQINRPSQADLGRWLDLLTQQIEDHRADRLAPSLRRDSSRNDFAARVGTA